MSRRRFAVVAALVLAAIAAVPATAWFLSTGEDRRASRTAFANQGTGLDATDVQSALAELATRVKQVEAGQSALASAQRTEVSSLQGTTQDQGIRLAGHEARVATLESRVAELAPVRTRLDYSEGASAASLGAEYAPLREFGSFAKRHAGTPVLLVWNTHVDAAGDPGSFCDLQLRIDGQPDAEADGGGGRGIVYVPAGAQGAASSLSVSALFGRVGPGTHTVSAWVRGSARACQENFGNFPRAVLVEEAPRG